MTKAKKGDKVKVQYTGRLSDNNIFDSSDNRGPLEFKIGDGQLIPGFEGAVVGMQVGESKTVTIAANEAYGDYQNEIPMERFPSELEPKVGQRFQVDQGDSKTFMVLVTHITDSRVTLDANHPLAGKDLIFDIELLEIAS